MLVCERVAKAFAAEGVTAVFGMMGASTAHWYHAIHKEGIRLFDVRHEGVALGMADGWARATGGTGVCSTTEGPGMAQLATALLTASRAGSPVVAFVGDCATTDPEHVQNMNERRFADACETGFVRIDSPLMVDEAVREAFYRARLESRPMMISTPVDVQLMKVEDDDPYQPSSALLPPRQRIRPDIESLERAADIIASCRKPLIIAGRGAVCSGAGEAVLRLAKRIGALIGTSLRAKNWLADAEYHVGLSGQYGTRTALQLFQESDCVVAVGAGMNRYTTSQGLLYPDARIVHIDSEPHVVMGAGRVADCYMQADARAAIEALDDVLAKRSVQMTGFRTAEVRERLARNYEDRTEFPIEPGCVDPREVCRMLDEMVPSDIPLATAGGAAAGFTNVFFNRPRPFVLAGHYFGATGQMLPAAMGAVVATGNKPLLLLDGDVGMMMHLADFDTAVRYDMPLLAVVLNDQALGYEYHLMAARNLNPDLAAVRTPDMGAIATAMGARGRLARSVAEVRAAASDWLARPGPMMVDVRISRNVLPITLRRLHYAKDE